MNKRIEKISSYINENDRVIDIGCDQALLSIILAKRNIKSYASDINKNIIKNAEEKINTLKLNDYVTFFVSDGLKDISDIDIDTLVLSGMGTFNIIEIINNSKFKFKKIIIVSNNNYDILRKKMNELNYRIINEEIIKEKGKYYDLILFEEGKETLTDYEISFGKNQINKKLFNEYTSNEINKLEEVYKKNKNEEVYKKIEALKKVY